MTTMTHYDHLNIDLTAAMAEVARKEAIYNKTRARVAKAKALIDLFDAQDVADGIAAELVRISNAVRGFALDTVSPITRSPAFAKAA